MSGAGGGGESARFERGSENLGAIFQKLQQSGKSGTLRLIGPEGRLKYVYFNRGVVELMKTSKSRTLLGRALVKRRLLNPKHLDEALARQAASNGELRLGQILIGLGMIPESELEKALRFQIAEEVLELFTWSSVKWDFIRGDPPIDIFEPEDLQSRVALSPERLCQEAEKRKTENEAIRRTITSFHDVYAPTADAAERYLSRTDAGAEREVIACCDGQRDVDEVLDEVLAIDSVALRVLAKMANAGEIASVAPAQLVALGQECEDRREFERARKRYLRAEELGHPDFDLPRRIGQIDEVLGDIPGACVRYILYADRCAQAGYPDVATATLTRVIELNTPQSGKLKSPLIREAREKLAAVLEKQGKSDEAAAVFELVLADLPNETPPEERVRAISAVLSVRPEKVELREELAALALSAGDPAQAIMELQDVAASWLAEENHARAVLVLRKILEIDPHEILTHQQLASTLAKMGEKDAAVAEYLSVAEHLHETGLATASAQTLVQIYEKVVELDPDNAQARKWLVQAYEGKEQADKAIANYTGLVGSLRRSGKKAELDAALDKLCAYQPDDRDLALERARLKKELGKEDEARTAFKALAEVATKAKETELAQTALAEVLAWNPGDLDSQLALAKVEGQSAKTALAARRCGAVFEIAFISGKLDIAEEAAKRALDIEPESAAHRERMARLHEARGRKDEAARTLVRAARLARAEDDLGVARLWAKRAVEVDPSSDEARDLIELLKRGSAPAPVIPGTTSGDAAGAPSAPAPVAPIVVAPFDPGRGGGQKLMPTITGGGSSSIQLQGVQSGKRVANTADRLKGFRTGPEGGPGASDLYQAPADAGSEDTINKKARSGIDKLRALKGGGPPPGASTGGPASTPGEGASPGEGATPGDGARGDLPAGTPGSANSAIAPELAKKASSAMERLRALKGAAPRATPAPIQAPPSPPADESGGFAVPVPPPPPPGVGESSKSPSSDAFEALASNAPAADPAPPPPPPPPPPPSPETARTHPPTGKLPRIAIKPSADLPAGTPGSANSAVAPELAKKASSAMERLRALKSGAPPRAAAEQPPVAPTPEAQPPPASPALAASAPAASAPAASAPAASAPASSAPASSGSTGSEPEHKGLRIPKLPTAGAKPSADLPAGTPGSANSAVAPELARKASSAMERLKALKSGAPPPPREPAAVASTPAGGTSPPSTPAAAKAEAAAALPAGTPGSANAVASPDVARKASSAMERLKALKSGGAAPKPGQAALPDKVSKGPEAPGDMADPALSKKASSAKERLRAMRSGGSPSKPVGTAEAQGRMVTIGTDGGLAPPPVPDDGVRDAASASSGQVPNETTAAGRTSPGEGEREPSGSEATA